MTTEALKAKTSRYLRGESVPSETRQIQNWLSCTAKADGLSLKERDMIKNEIVTEIRAYIEYTQLDPKPKYWWQKITAFF